MKWFRWLFIGGLTAVPLAINLSTQQVAAVHPLFHQLTLPWWQQTLPALFFAMVMGISSSCLLFVPAALQTWPMMVKLTFTAVLTFFTIVIFWLAIMLAYTAAMSGFGSGLGDGTLIAPTWLLRIGWGGTAVIIIGVMYWSDQLYLLTLDASANSA